MTPKYLRNTALKMSLKNSVIIEATLKKAKKIEEGHVSGAVISNIDASQGFKIHRMIFFQSKMNTAAKQMMTCQTSCKNYQWLRKYFTSKTRVSGEREKAHYFIFLNNI